MRRTNASKSIRLDIEENHHNLKSENVLGERFMKYAYAKKHIPKLLSFGQQYNKVLRGVGVLAILLDGLKQHEFLLGADQHNGNPDQLERKLSYSSFKKHFGSKDDIISSSKLIESVPRKFPFFEIKNIVVDAWGRDSQI
ncbi:hypothetical protein AAG906_023556 [Vitis piasezkii]